MAQSRVNPGIFFLRALVWGENNRPKSPTHYVDWMEHGVMTATCPHTQPHAGPWRNYQKGEWVESGDTHRVPEEHCSCGIYGTWDLDVLMGYTRHDFAVVTLCLSAGKTLEFEIGVRCKQAVVTKLVWWHDKYEQPLTRDIDKSWKSATLAAAAYFQREVIPMEVALEVISQQRERMHEWIKQQRAIQEQARAFFIPRLNDTNNQDTSGVSL